jgi:hypothetical protein
VVAAEIGKASGVFNMGRFLGGMFGIAALVAVFSGSGAVDSPEAFSTGFAAAMSVASALSLLGAVAGLWLPARQSRGTSTGAGPCLKSSRDDNLSLWTDQQTALDRTR